MKNLIIAALIFVSFTAFSQRGDGHHKKEMTTNLSAEEVATLQTKKMTLALALDEGQAKKVYPLMLNQAKDRKATRDAQKAQDEKSKLTEEQRYEKANESLDKRIAIQNKMKNILTEEQFKKFKKMNTKKGKRARGDKGKKRDSRSKK